MLSLLLKERGRIIWHVFMRGRTCTFRGDIRYRMLVSVSPVFDFRYWSNSVTNSSLLGYVNVNQCRVSSSAQNNRRNVGSTASRYAIAPLDSCKSAISSLGRKRILKTLGLLETVGRHVEWKKKEKCWWNVLLSEVIFTRINSLFDERMKLRIAGRNKNQSSAEV